MSPLQECQISIQNMLQDTAVILQRRDKIQEQLLKESWIAFGIELAELNGETADILNDNSWRNKK